MSFYEDSTIRRKRLQDGQVTIIPFIGFPRLAKHIPGFIPGDQVVITANTAIGKSRFMRKLCIKDPIKFAEQSGIKLKIFLNSLEETAAKVESTFVASVLHEKYGISLDYYTLNHYCFAGNMPNDDVWLKVKDCKDFVEENIKKYVEVIHISNGFGIYKHVRQWLALHGVFSFKGNPVAIGDQWDHYEPNDPNTFVIVITDTINKLQPEAGDDLYRSIRRFSEVYSRKHLGMSCGVINVLIQQQSPDKEKLELNLRGHTLIEKLKPSLDALRDVRSTQEDATIVLGLFSPGKYKEYSYGGYEDIRKVKGKFRSLVLLKTRESALDDDNELPLIAYFERDEFEELPTPDDEKLKEFLVD